MPRPMKRSRLLAVLAVLLLAGSLVGSVIVIQQVRAQDPSPVGQWSVALTRADVPVDVAGGFSYVGRWRLTIDADGTYQASRSDIGTAVTGAWTVDGNQITFTDDSGGLLSCADGAAAPIITDDMASGVYTWERIDKTLKLTRVDDACPGRVILLTTFSFTPFVACETQPLSMAELLGSPVASPIAEEPVVEASPETAPAVLTPTASPEANVVGPVIGAPLASPASASINFASEIDDLLAQLTACWATREPERWLPLLSNEFRDALIQSDPNFLETLTISMTSPIVWERAGDITIVAPNQISATVKSTSGTEEDYQKFVFVFEDGQWKWNG